MNEGGKFHFTEGTKLILQNNKYLYIYIYIYIYMYRYQKEQKEKIVRYHMVGVRINF